MYETYNLIAFQDFKDGKVDTAFIPKHEDDLQAVSELLISSGFLELLIETLYWLGIR